MHLTLRPELTDPQLIAAAAAGDQDAYQAIIGRHERVIYGYLRARLIEAADAEDLCQEVFLRAYTSLARFAGDVSARPWLFGFARNILREHLRRASRRHEALWTELCLRVDDCREPQEGMYDDLLAHLPDCLAALGPSARLAIELRYAGGMNHAAIAGRLCRSPDAVKLILYRARRALRRCLESKKAELRKA